MFFSFTLIRWRNTVHVFQWYNFFTSDTFFVSEVTLLSEKCTFYVILSVLFFNSEIGSRAGLA
jgi:hypothetical protein